jgi:outer membrane protein TolC
MRRLAFACMFLALGAAAQEPGTPLTFDEAVSLTARGGDVAAPPVETGFSLLRRATWPSVRAEVIGNASRTLDFATASPLDLRSTNAVLAFDYPLFDAGLTAARVEAVRAKLQRLADRRRLDDAKFAQLVESFGQLFLSQRQSEVLRPLYERLSDETSRTTQLVAAGEMSNLTAADWQEVALSFGSQLLELESRRIDAAAKVQLLTGLETEPVVVIDFANERTEPPAAELRDDATDSMRIALDESRLRLREVVAMNGFRATLSAFIGLGAAQSEFRDVRGDDTSSIYGLRVNLSYPLFRGAGEIHIAEARAALQQNQIWHDAAVDAARTRAAEYRMRARTAERRIALMQQSVSAARSREQSLRRLVGGGVRAQSELIRAEAERTRREVDLLAARIERWKAGQLLDRMTAPAEASHR